MTRPKMFALFYVIAFGGGVLIAFLFAGVWSTPGGEQKAVRILHLLPVLFATLVVQGPILKQPVLKPLGIVFKPNRWWAIAWLSPLVMLAVGLVVSAAMGHDIILDAASYVARKRAALPIEALPEFDASVAASPPGSPLYFVGPGLLAGVTLNLLLALATEVGWRGFLFREVQGGFWRRSLLIGASESFYFAPIVALGYRYDVPADGLFLSLLWCLVASPVLVYLRVRSGSVIACAVFRGTILGLVAVAADLTDAPAQIAPFFGVGGTAGLLVVLGLCALHDRFLASTPLMRAGTAKE